METKVGERMRNMRGPPLIPPKFQCGSSGEQTPSMFGSTHWTSCAHHPHLLHHPQLPGAQSLVILGTIEILIPLVVIIHLLISPDGHGNLGTMGFSEHEGQGDKGDITAG